jgi:glycosyltransferase involved in cell wall biosynthesis
MKTLAPIALFAYNRPQHLRKVLEALQNNKLAEESDLYIFCDGPKTTATAEELAKIEAVRVVAAEKKWCKTVTIHAQSKNRGLANSIIQGVTEIVSTFQKIIVLEDDLVPFPYFLSYMNAALDMYENETNVACISAYVYPVKSKLPESFFIQGADCWGWATWQRAWNCFESDGKKLLDVIETNALQKKFDFDFTYPYVQMLKDQIHHKNDSWAIRWYASAFIKNMLCLYPGKSLIQNIGIDGSGTHSGSSDKWNVAEFNENILLQKIPTVQHKHGYKAFKHYFKSLGPALKLRVKNFIKKILGR